MTGALRLVDTHVHLNFPQFDADRAAILKRLEEQQIGVINISTDLGSVDQTVQLASENPHIWGAIGLHPTDIAEDTLIKLPALLDSWRQPLAANAKIVAIGEVGLDYFRDHSPESAHRQQTALREFLSFALEQQKPVVFHCREAYGDLLTILKDYQGLEGTIHCFNGSAAQAAGFLEAGMHLSFTAMLTYSANDALRQIAATVPTERLLLETDCPFLPPQNRRGQRNDPLTVEEIAQLLSELRGRSAQEIAAQTTENATRLFRLGASHLIA